MKKQSRAFDWAIVSIVLLVMAVFVVVGERRARNDCELENQKLKQIIADQQKTIEMKPDTLVVPQEKRELPQPARTKRRRVNSQTFAYPQMPPISNAPVMK
jgi:hypothetical protein